MSHLIYIIKYKFVLATSGDVCWGTWVEIYAREWNIINIRRKDFVNLEEWTFSELRDESAGALKAVHVNSA
jgi:hypothetical protein